MKPRDLFGLAVRVLGLWFLTQNLYWFMLAAVKAHDSSFGNPNISPREDMGYGIIYLILGILLMACADPIVWAVYGLPPKLKSPDVADSGSANAMSDDAELPKS